MANPGAPKDSEITTGTNDMTNPDVPKSPAITAGKCSSTATSGAPKGPDRKSRTNEKNPKQAKRGRAPEDKLVALTQPTQVNEMNASAKCKHERKLQKVESCSQHDPDRAK